MSEGAGNPLSEEGKLLLPVKGERRKKGRMSLGSYGMIFSSCIVVLSVGVFALSMLNYMTALSRSDLEDRGRLVVDSVKSSISQDLALDDRFAVVERCTALVKDSREIEYIVITIRDGTSLVHTPDGWEETDGDTRWASFETGENASEIIDSDLTPQEVLHFSHEISYLTSLPLGWVHIGMSMDSYRENLYRFHTRTTLLALLALAFGIPASLLFTRQFTKPITLLQKFAERIAAGDLSQQVDAGGSKEIVRLSETMNWMSESLADSQSRIKDSLKEKAALREKDVLLREIHHRVKNNMQILGGLIRIQCRSLKSEEAKQVLVESETRIRSMALLHQKLYQSDSISEISFEGYVRVLADELRRLYGSSAPGVSVQVNIDPEFKLGLDTALPCGLIVNELVSNSFKYGYPSGAKGTISVSVRPGETADAFTLEVADDGVGLPENFSIDGAKTLGIRLVSMLVEQLDGTAEVGKPEHGSGGRFTLDLRVSNYTERLENES